MSKRITKTHARQYERYLMYLERHHQLKTGAGDPQKIAALWDRITVELNAMGVGSQRTAKDWRKVFQQWKNQTRHKARLISEHCGGTGGGPASKKVLSDIEERLLSASGRQVLDGTGIGDSFNTIDNKTDENEPPSSPDFMIDETPQLFVQPQRMSFLSSPVSSVLLPTSSSSQPLRQQPRTFMLESTKPSQSTLPMQTSASSQQFVFAPCAQSDSVASVVLQSTKTSKSTLPTQPSVSSQQFVHSPRTQSASVLTVRSQSTTPSQPTTSSQTLPQPIRTQHSRSLSASKRTNEQLTSYQQVRLEAQQQSDATMADAYIRVAEQLQAVSVSVGDLVISNSNAIIEMRSSFGKVLVEFSKVLAQNNEIMQNQQQIIQSLLQNRFENFSADSA